MEYIISVSPSAQGLRDTCQVMARGGIWPPRHLTMASVWYQRVAEQRCKGPDSNLRGPDSLLCDISETSNLSVSML